MVSTVGGAQPRWRADGKILYLSQTAGKLMSVEVTPGEKSLQSEVPKPLFDVAVVGGPTMPTPSSRWDMTRDGKNFLFNSPAGETVAAPINIVLNWRNMLQAK